MNHSDSNAKPLNECCPDEAREYSTNVREHASHNRHTGHSVSMFRDKFWLSLGLTLPVVFWSGEVQRWLGYRAPTFTGSRLIPAVLGTIILVYGGRVFYSGCTARAFRRPAGHDDLDQSGFSAPRGRNKVARVIAPSNNVNR
jgi:cation transport ATPase